MLDTLEFKELALADINDNLLDEFNRYQKVTRLWVKTDEGWTLTDGDYTVDWDKEKKDSLIDFFADLIKEGRGHIFGAYFNKNIAGFAVLMNENFGTRGQYIQLKFLHVSLDYRHKGIGKKLFELCVKKAREMGSEKIYISANDSEATQQFYLGLGCKDAEEINQKMADEEPYDRQMEYIV